MSGPYCKTCKFFQDSIMQSSPDVTDGECADPTKIIYHERTGNPKNEKPLVVGEWHSCPNHEQG